ncbi:hypothetical protein [Colwellia psychrerythraea]|uniref:Uncharacterized protein n=1 Tax=Colwellia psychrerythraea TaxID=28229 RepID=A0A099KAL3_COLPS|nr:hypothetical protein [Colwellia psychrerythraea]KGJ87764.1 hypothetical protein GAB14E_4442 [Colwellia psychrerythraea]
MNAVNSTASNYVGLVQKAVTRNTVHQVVDAKQSGTPINKEEIKESNQEIKDKSVQAGISVYQANLKKQTVDTYIQSTEKANDIYGTDSSDSTDTEINSFDAQAVNDARSTVHKRAIGISVYEQVQSTKDDKQTL